VTTAETDRLQSNSAQASPHLITIGRLSIDLLACCANLNGCPVHLSPHEFDLLAYLAHHAGRVVPLDELWQEVWHCCPAGGTADQIKSCVKRLRQRIEPDPKRPCYVLAVRGYGYMIPASIEAEGTNPDDAPARLEN
jgi:two-component system KDP operon response regulator KdpE